MPLIVPDAQNFNLAIRHVVTWHIVPRTIHEECGRGMPWGLSGHHAMAVHKTTLAVNRLSSVEAKIHILNMLYRTLTT